MESRQLAIIVWVAIFAIWALSMKQVRSSMLDVLRAVISPKILLTLAVIIGWNIAVVLGLHRVGFWNPTMVYDTVLFVAVGGIGSLLKAATPDVTYDRRFFLRTLLTNLGFIVLFAFLSDFFAFSFWIEFLVVVPLMTIVVTLAVFSEKQKGAEDVHRFLSNAQAFLGIILLAYLAWKVVSEFDQLTNPQVLFSFFLPFVMSVFFVPLLFLICALATYQDAYAHLGLCADGIKPLVRYKKWKLLVRFRLNTRALQSFRRSPTFQDLRYSENREEAKRILKV